MGLPPKRESSILTIWHRTIQGNTVSGFTVSGGALVGSTRTFTLTQTGDLDGGALDDTLSFDLIYEAYTGSTFLSRRCDLRGCIDTECEQRQLA